MTKLEKVLEILKMLSSGDRIPAEVMAANLQVPIRQIRGYMDELNRAGVSIGSERGPNGGYYLMSCPICNKLK